MGKTEKNMGRFKVDDYVTYRKNGVCKITSIELMSFGGQEKKEYYVLNSVYDSNTRLFVPLQSELENEMRYVLTAEEINKAIKDSLEIEDKWEDNVGERNALFNEIMNSGDKAKMLWLIRNVTAYKAEADKKRRRMKANDVKCLNMAVSTVEAEFAYPLGLKRAQVMGYVKKMWEDK